VGPIEKLVGLSQAIDGLLGEIMPFQCDSIDTSRPGGMAFYQHERRNIVPDGT
jgi:hypothetical protein